MRIDYRKYNWCSRCDLIHPKDEFKCRECHNAIKTRPHVPKGRSREFFVSTFEGY